MKLAVILAEEIVSSLTERPKLNSDLAITAAFVK